MVYSGYSVFSDMLYQLERLGIMDIILPFVLIFTLVFATLQKTKILGDKKNFNVIISLALALGVVIPHATNSYPYGMDVVDIINTALPQIALVMVVILGILILIGMWGVAPAWEGPVSGFVMIASFIVVIAIFAGAVEWINIPYFLEDPETQALIIVLIVFGLIVKVITAEKKESTGESMLDGVKKFFKKV